MIDLPEPATQYLRNIIFYSTRKLNTELAEYY
jgi:hypothetical protein